MVCVDDFALRKRFSYGTVMVNLENCRIIDMIPPKETSTVEKWLSTFPNIEVVSRDGASTYSSVTSSSHPDAVQISDWFHFIKGLSEVINKYIIREFPARIEIPITAPISEEIKALYNTANPKLADSNCSSKAKRGIYNIRYCIIITFITNYCFEISCYSRRRGTRSSFYFEGRQHQLAIQQKQQEINEARKLVEEGYPIEQIAIMMHHTYKTTQNYLNPNYSVANGHYNVRIPGKLALHEKDVIELRSQGMTYPKIPKILCKKGYTGSVDSLRMFM